MSFAHMLILGIIAIIVIPPEKLPEVAKQIAKFIYELKRTADQFMGEIKQEAMFKPEDIIDQNLKNKIYELQSEINKPINLDGHSESTNHSHQKTNESQAVENNETHTPPAIDSSIEKKKNE